MVAEPILMGDENSIPKNTKSSAQLYSNFTTDESDEAAFARPEHFEDMVGDLRRTFFAWLKRTEGDLRKERAALIQERIKLKNEKEKMWVDLSREREIELAHLEEERKRLHSEASATMKQISVERDEARKRMDMEQMKLENQVRMWRKKLDLERKQFYQEVHAFEEEKRKVIDTNVAAQTMVEINVGGVVFETSRSTLTQQPGSLLEGLVSGRHQVARDKNGRIFLDRDAELFRTLLHFLRDPSNPPCPRDSTESQTLCSEAGFYGIHFFPYPLVLALGGHNGAEHLSSVEFLDVSDRCWRPCASMSTPRTYAGFAELSGRVLGFGGQNLDYRALCDAECYDILRDTWYTSPFLNHPRKNVGAVTFEGRVYAVGGYNGASILSSVEAYDPRTKHWVEVANLNSPRSAAAVTVADDYIWAIGGSKGDRLKTVEKYDPRMDAWQEVPCELIEVRSAACATSHLGHIYVFGGTDNTHATHTSVETLDTRTATKWSFCQSLPEPRMDAAAVLASAGSILVAGGQNGSALRSTVFFRPDIDEWKTGSPMLTPRYGHGLIVATI